MAECVLFQCKFCASDLCINLQTDKMFKLTTERKKADYQNLFICLSQRLVSQKRAPMKENP